MLNGTAIGSGGSEGKVTSIEACKADLRLEIYDAQGFKQFEGIPLDIAAKLLGVSEATVWNDIVQYKQCVTPEYKAVC